MITQETLLIDGVELIRTYSDTYMLLQVETGAIYVEAIDVPNKYTYIEVEDLPLHKEEDFLHKEEISTEEQTNTEE